MERAEQLQRMGWLCFKLMWIPFITIFAGMMGMPEGEYAWAELPLLTRVSLMLVGAFFVGSSGCMIGAQVVRMRAGHRIRTHGRTAEATVVKVWDTGTTINKNPVIGLRLKIEAAADHPAFEAETTQLVSRLQMGHFQAGTRVQVKYLPDSQEVALPRPAVAGSGPDTKSRK